MAGISSNNDNDSPNFTSQLFDIFKGNTCLQQFYSSLILKTIQQQQQHVFDGLCQKNSTSPAPTMVIKDSALKSTKTRSPEEGQHSSPDTDIDDKPRKRIRIRGQSVKTAEVWKYFVQIPYEQAAICTICQKTIKATNSSTTGMIRHLRSCHTKEHELLQNARRENYLRKGLKNGVLDDQQLNQLAMLERFKEITNGRDEQSKNDNSIHDSDTTSDVVETSASTSSVLSDSDMKPLHTIDRLMDLSSDVSSDKSLNNSSMSDTSHTETDTSDENIDKMSLQMEVNDHLVSIFSCNILPVDIVENPLFRRLFHTLRPELSLGSADEFRQRIQGEISH